MLALPEAVLELQDVGVRLHGNVLLDGVNLTLHRGEKLVVLGVSGAGKSLLLDVIAGNIFHTGTARFSPAVSKAQRTFSFDTFAALSLLKVGEVLRFLETAYRVEANVRLRNRFQLTELLAKPIRVLSKGERKRVGVYAALFSDPAVAVLDEPTDGMDPMMRDIFWQTVNERAGATLLTTHLWEEAGGNHDRIALMGGGRLLAAPASEADLLRLFPYTGKVVVDAMMDGHTTFASLVIEGRRHLYYAGDDQKKQILRALGPRAAASGYSVLPIDLTDTYRLLANLENREIPS